MPYKNGVYEWEPVPIQSKPCYRVTLFRWDLDDTLTNSWSFKFADVIIWFRNSLPAALQAEEQIFQRNVEGHGNRWNTLQTRKTRHVHQWEMRGEYQESWKNSKNLQSICECIFSHCIKFNLKPWSHNHYCRKSGATGKSTPRLRRTGAACATATAPPAKLLRTNSWNGREEVYWHRKLRYNNFLWKHAQLV